MSDLAENFAQAASEFSDRIADLLPDNPPPHVARSGAMNPEAVNKLVNDKRRLEETIVRLVSALSYIENHPTLLLDTDLLVAVNFKVPGCEGCFTAAQNIAIAVGDRMRPSIPEQTEER